MDNPTRDRHTLRVIGYAALAAFGTYFCMYAYRKPFNVATFEGIRYFGVDYKILLIIAQVLGYALAKFLGIKFISELRPERRLAYLFGLALVAEGALLLFALVPAPYNIALMFVNGIPLGMIWGIVFSYLEGRRYTDVLGVVLSSSFIMASGVVKSIGLYVMNVWGVGELAMPAVVGGLFVLPMFFFGKLLDRTPPPTEEDKRLRVERLPMDGADRMALLGQFLLSIVLFVGFYTFLTAFREFRDNFSRELWDSIGFTGDASVYATSEIVVALVVLVIVGLFFYVRDNAKALFAYHGLMIIGLLGLGIATFLFQTGAMDPYVWMVATGFGLYVCYVPFNSVLFDRYIAAFRMKGNSGFFIYMADAFGYVGSIAVLLYKNFGQANLSWLDFFVYGTYTLAAFGVVLMALSYFHLKRRHDRQSMSADRD